MSKDQTTDEKATFHRDQPNVDPMRVRFERFMETWAEYERARGVDSPSPIFGTAQEIDAAKVLLMADVHQQASIFEPEIVKACTERGIISTTETQQLEAILQRLGREKELLQMRDEQKDRNQERER